MSNVHVRAAAEGMPEINRRSLLLGAAATISTAAAVATFAPHAHAAPTSLEEAIATCQRAEEIYGSRVARENAIAEALGDKLFPKWTPPGGLSSIWSHLPQPFRSSSKLEIEIERKAEQIEASFARGLMNRAAFDRLTRELADQGGEGLTSLREQEAVIDASGHREASSLADEAVGVWNAAFNTVLRHPCQTMDEVKAKAVCLIHGYEQLGMPVDGEEFVACLASFCGEA